MLLTFSLLLVHFMAPAIFAQQLNPMRIDVVPVALTDPRYTCLSVRSDLRVQSLTQNATTLQCDFAVTSALAQNYVTEIISPVVRYLSRSLRIHVAEYDWLGTSHAPVFQRSWSWLCGSADGPLSAVIPSIYLYPSQASYNTDLVIFVTFQPQANGEEQFSYGRPCQHHPRSYRANMAILNINPKHDPKIKHDAQTLVLHELLHILAINDDFWATDPTLFGLPRDKVITTAKRPEGYIAQYISTPKVLAFVRQHSACPSAAGLELEDDGKVGVDSHHWESRVYHEDIMSLIIGSKMTNLTWLFLEDTGWYTVDFFHARPAFLGTGFHRGCDFTNQSCNAVIGGYNTDYCINDYELDRCISDKSGVGRCGIDDVGYDLPYNERYFKWPYVGGLDVQEHCPVRWIGWNDEMNIDPCAAGTVCVDYEVSSRRNSECLPFQCEPSLEASNRLVPKFMTKDTNHSCPRNGLPGLATAVGPNGLVRSTVLCSYAELYCARESHKKISFDDLMLSEFDWIPSIRNAGATTNVTVKIAAKAAIPFRATILITIPAGLFDCSNATIGTLNEKFIFGRNNATGFSNTLVFVSLNEVNQPLLIFNLLNCVNPPYASQPGHFLVQIFDASMNEIVYDSYRPPSSAITFPQETLNLFQFATSCMPREPSTRGAVTLSLSGQETILGDNAVLLSMALTIEGHDPFAPVFVKWPPNTFFDNLETAQSNDTTIYRNQTIFLVNRNWTEKVQVRLYIPTNRSAFRNTFPTFQDGFVVGTPTACFKVSAIYPVVISTSRPIENFQVFTDPTCVGCKSNLTFSITLPQNRTFEKGWVIRLRIPYIPTLYITKGYLHGNGKEKVTLLGPFATDPKCSNITALVNFPEVEVRLPCNISNPLQFTIGGFRNPLEVGDPGGFDVRVTDRGWFLMYKVFDSDPKTNLIGLSGCGMNNCSGHGECDSKKALCVCLPGFQGARCESCQPDAYPSGICDKRCVGVQTFREMREVCSNHGILELITEIFDDGSNLTTCGCTCDALWSQRYCGDTCEYECNATVVPTSNISNISIIASTPNTSIPIASPTPQPTVVPTNATSRNTTGTAPRNDTGDISSTDGTPKPTPTPPPSTGMPLERYLAFSIEMGSGYFFIDSEFILGLCQIEPTGTLTPSAARVLFVSESIKNNSFERIIVTFAISVNDADSFVQKLDSYISSHNTPDKNRSMGNNLRIALGATLQLFPAIPSRPLSTTSPPTTPMSSSETPPQRPPPRWSTDAPPPTSRLSTGTPPSSAEAASLNTNKGGVTETTMWVVFAVAVILLILITACVYVFLKRKKLVRLQAAAQQLPDTDEMAAKGH